MKQTAKLKFMNSIFLSAKGFTLCVCLSSCVLPQSLCLYQAVKIGRDWFVWAVSELSFQGLLSLGKIKFHFIYLADAYPEQNSLIRLAVLHEMISNALRVSMYVAVVCEWEMEAG